MLTQDNHLPTAELQRLDAAHHIHPFTDRAAMNKRGARVITRAEGVYLWDSDGNRLLDGMAGLWCVNLGYGRNDLVEAATRQLGQLPYYNTFFQTSHPPAIELASKLATIAPGHLNHVFYAGSGSEANDTNIRLVRHYWASVGKPEKTIFITRKNSYHGSTVGAGSLSGMGAMHDQGGLPIPDIVHIDQPYWYGEGGDSDPNQFGLERARALEAEIERLGADKVAAFIGEPVQGAGGVIVPPETYWPEISRICKKHDILLIADEVITGFGRTGNWFGSETFGFEPDIMTNAKGITSGYLPLGASIVSDAVAEGLRDKGGEFYHGYTYSGHPTACAVALATIEAMENEQVVETVRSDTAPYLAEKWRELAAHPLVGEARICGMMAAIALSPDPQSRAPFKGETGEAGLVCRDICFENGLVMRSVGDSMVISPPLVISRNEIDELCALATTALDETMVRLKAMGKLG